MASKPNRGMGNKPGALQGAKVGSHDGAEHLTKALTVAVKNGQKEGFRVELDDDKNLYKWQIHLFDFPATCNLAYVASHRKLIEDYVFRLTSFVKMRLQGS
jgi:hypothetical protein